MSRQHGFRESLSYCLETCPDVDGAFSEAWSDLRDLVADAVATQAEAILFQLCARVKEVGTDKLRDALCSAVRDKEEVEGERNDLQHRVNELESRIADLQWDAA